nr:hypothetical protein CcurKRNrm3_p051 [Cryptomonas curvata]
MSIVFEYGNAYEAQVALFFLKKINFLPKNLISKLLKINKKTYYSFNDGLKKPNILIEIKKIYKEEHSEILLLVEKFKFCLINIKNFKNFRFFNQIFNLESYDFFITEYFFQIMNGEIHLLRKIKISIDLKNHYNSEFKNNNSEKIKKKIFTRNYHFNYKILSSSNVFVIINNLNRNLYKKIYEISGLVLNFSWYQSKNILHLLSNKKTIIKSDNLFEIKFFNLIFNFLNLVKSSSLFPTIKSFLFLFFFY